MELTEKHVGRRWRLIAITSLAFSMLLAIVLATGVVIHFRTAWQTDERLIGTWQSDADRTIAGMNERRPLEEKQKQDLRKIFGILKITYSQNGDLKTDMAGSTDQGRYEILGKDKLSVAIRETGGKGGFFETSEFTIIHFDGPDSYWLHTEIGGVKEYFKRVR